jgi:AGZA family xanthine/uracil permease-like MFS transporter
MSDAAATFRPKWWVKGDWNAFFGLFSNALMNVMVLSGLMLFVVKIPAGTVFGTIIPAVGISLIVGNIYYAYMARRLARKEGREDVTAMPYGPSVPHYFLVTFLIMLPVVIRTGDPMAAWKVGLAWCFIEGVIEILGAAVAKFIRKYTPRAAMLGTLAGISIAFISMTPAFQMMEVPWIGFLSFAIILIAWFAIVPMPWKIPGGLVIIILGTVLGWLTGVMDPAGVGEAVANFRISFPLPHVGALLEGFRNFGPLLATAIPMGIYNFTEGMNNVESAAAAGDEYNVSEVTLVDGIGSLIGAALGSPFPTAVYIGHPGWKDVGGRIGYSLATGIGIGVVCLLGVLPLVLAIIPVVAVVPILLYIGAVIGAQAFQSSPPKHAPAVVLALIPNFAAWGKTLVDGALGTAGTNAAEVGYAALSGNGVVYAGMEILSGGAILTGLIWAAIAVFAIDRKWHEGAIYALLGAVLSFFGIIHAGNIALAAAWQVSIGYLIMAALLLVMPMIKGAAPESS